ncbi:NAD-P-binding protein [Mycena haematopus]|nr:NAD-P-binding protein [Mycena haematopus]
MSDLLHAALQKSGLGTDTPPAVPYSRPASPHGGSYPSQIGFVGLGAMGGLMAKNLANHRAAHVHASPPILVWNRSPAKAEGLLKELGAGKVRVAGTLEQVVTECDIVFTALANDETVKSVYERFVQTLKVGCAGELWALADATYGIAHAAREEQNIRRDEHDLPNPRRRTRPPRLLRPHCHLIASPVFGTPFVAAAAQLVIVMAGDYRSKKEVAYMLVPAVGKKVIDLGGNIEKASTFKLIGNSMILGTMEILAESYTLAEKSGIAPGEIHGLVKDIFPAPGIIRYSERMSTNHFDGTTGFSIEGGIKDASHIRRLTAVHNSPMPSIDIAHQHLITARAIHTAAVQAGIHTPNVQAAKKAGGEDAVEVLDWSGMIAGTRVAAGLDAFGSSNVHGVVTED